MHDCYLLSYLQQYSHSLNFINLQNFSSTNQVSSKNNQIKSNGNIFEQARKYSEKSSVKRKEKGYGSASDSDSDSDKEKGKRVSF